MKSPKKRRNDIKTERSKKRAAAEQEAVASFHAKLRSVERAHEAKRAQQRLLVDKQVWVTPHNLRPTKSHGAPDFVARGYYVDRPFTCKDCSAQEVWRATQQKWWYETAKGDVWTTATRCQPCRRKEQDRKRQARQVHLEGVFGKDVP